jgi:tetratricopeptide (TPR) repeat protein
MILSGEVFVLTKKYLLIFCLLFSCSLSLLFGLTINGSFYSKYHNLFFKFDGNKAYFSKFFENDNLLSFKYDNSGDQIIIFDTPKNNIHLKPIDENTFYCDKVLYSGNYEKISDAESLLLESRLPISNNDTKISLLTKALSLVDTSNDELKAVIINSKGKIYYQKGNYEKAIEDFTNAINLYSSNPDFYENRGLAYIYKGENNKVKEEFDKVIDENYGYADESVYYLRGGLNYNEGKHDLAIEDLSKAIDTNPEFTEAYNLRGNSYSFIGKYENAISDFTKVIELNPAFTEAYLNRGKAYEESGNMEKANADYAFANPNKIAKDYFQKGEFEKALNFYNKLVKDNSNDFNLFYEKGFCNLKINNLDEAISDFNTALKIKNDSFETYNLLGIVYYLQNNYEKSIESFEQSLNINSEYIYPKMLKLMVYYNFNNEEYKKLLNETILQIGKMNTSWEKQILEYFCGVKTISDLLYYTNKETDKKEEKVSSSYLFIGLKNEMKGLSGNAKTCFRIAEEKSQITEITNYFSAVKLDKK